jgi:C_GCAxxG_C_C family probable redox protein
MDQKKNLAINFFNNGLNCAQSVLMPFAEDLKADKNTLKKVALGFGGGMGRLQKTCGAVTGAFMVLSLFAVQHSKDEEMSKTLAREMIRDFHREFILIHNSSDCRDLLGYDLNTKEGQVLIEEHRLSESVCSICIGDAVNIIERLVDTNERRS